MSFCKFNREVSTCDDCGEYIKIPPGVYYRGDRLCKHCFQLRRRVDLTDEVVEPSIDELRDAIEEALSEST